VFKHYIITSFASACVTHSSIRTMRTVQIILTDCNVKLGICYSKIVAGRVPVYAALEMTVKAL